MSKKVPTEAKAGQIVPSPPKKGYTKNGKKIGCPSIYTPEIAREVCARLEQGLSLRKICIDPAMPDMATLLRWAMNGDHPFCQQYALAKRVQAERMIAEILDITDDSTNDTQIDENGKRIINHDHINRARLRVDTRKWIACRVLPKIYGDKLQKEVSGEVTLRVVYENRPEIAAPTVQGSYIDIPVEADTGDT